MNSPLVSVIILSYNNKNFLTECIDSVLSQTYQHFQIIISDDCSTDGSIEVLEFYKKNYPDKIHLMLSEVNIGITSNSNKAVKACKGKYVAWMGSDDIMFKEKLEKQVMYMEKNPVCNISYHNLDVFDSDSQKHLYYFNNKRNAKQGKIEQLIKYGTFNGACSTMTRATAAPVCGFDERIPVASDWLYWVDHLGKGGEIHYIDEVLGKYRRHITNVTNHAGFFAQQGFKDLITTINIIEEKYVGYEKEIKYRLSYIYFFGRRFQYESNLLKSIRYNFLKINAWALLVIYYCSFKKIKL